jgi:hypothetical protein
VGDIRFLLEHHVLLGMRSIGVTPDVRKISPAFDAVFCPIGNGRPSATALDRRVELAMTGRVGLAEIDLDPDLERVAPDEPQTVVERQGYSPAGTCRDPGGRRDEPLAVVNASLSEATPAAR